MNNINSGKLGFSGTKLALAFGLAVLLAAALVPRLVKPGQYVATDEVPWLVRSGNFYYALGQRQFEKTAYGHGTITMWIETAAYLIDFPEYRGLGQGYFDVDKYWQFEEFVTSHGVNPHDLLVHSRILTGLVNALLLLGSYFLARLLFGTLPALVGFLLIALDPYHISLTRVAHLDGLNGSFLFLSLLAFLVYLHARRHFVYLLVSAAAGGMAWLAKLPGIIIVPTVGLLTLINPPSDSSCSGTGNRNKFRERVPRVLKVFIIWGTALILTVLILAPNAWVDPLTHIKKMSYRPITAGHVVPVERIEGALRPTFSEDEPADIFESIAEDRSMLEFLDQPLEYYLRYPSRHMWFISPVVLIGLGAAIAAILFKLSIFKSDVVRRSVFGLLLFILLFTTLITLAPKSSFKYFFPAVPALGLISGLGWFAAADFLSEHLKTRTKKYVPALILTGVILNQAGAAVVTYPYYSTYINPLMGGVKKANATKAIGSGEGLDQAARYLNGKKEPESLKALSSYAEGPFSYFFKGKAYPISSPVWTEEMIAVLKEMDYLVIYSRQWKFDLPRGLLQSLESVEPEHTIWINGFEFARIYDVSRLPEEVFQPFDPDQ